MKVQYSYTPNFWGTAIHLIIGVFLASYFKDFSFSDLSTIPYWDGMFYVYTLFWPIVLVVFFFIFIFQSLWVVLGVLGVFMLIITFGPDFYRLGRGR